MATKGRTKPKPPTKKECNIFKVGSPKHKACRDANKEKQSQYKTQLDAWKNEQKKLDTEFYKKQKTENLETGSKLLRVRPQEK